MAKKRDVMCNSCVGRKWAYGAMNVTNGGQLDELQQPHFRREIRRQPCFNETKYFSLFNCLLFVVTQLKELSCSQTQESML